MSLEEFRLRDAWRKVEESMRNGDPLNEAESKSESGGRGRYPEATTNPKENIPDPYDEDRNEGLHEEEISENEGGLGMTTAGPGTSKSPVDAADPNRKQGIARYAQKLGKGKRRKEEVDEDFDPVMSNDDYQTDPNAMGGNMDYQGGMSDMHSIIDRLQSRFPSADIMLSVKLPSGATFSDAEIEAALDAVEGPGDSYDDMEGGMDYKNGDDENDDNGDDENEAPGADAIEFSNTPDDDDEEEDYDDEDDDTAEEEGDDDEEMEEGDVLPGARKPKQGPDEYLHNTGINEDQHTHDEGRKPKEGPSEYRFNTGIQEAEERDSSSDKDQVEPCCFTMTVDQWEAFFQNDPFGKGNVK